MSKSFPRKSCRQIIIVNQKCSFFLERIGYWPHSKSFPRKSCRQVKIANQKLSFFWNVSGILPHLSMHEQSEFKQDVP